jgi:hypothetical protein
MVYAPGVVRWAANGYKWPKDRANMVRVIAEGWGIPSEAVDALLSGAAPHTVEDDAVVFSYTDEPQRKTFLVTARYATKTGRPGSWTFRMASTWKTILADADRHVAKYRPDASKVDIDAVCLKQ